MSKEVTLLVTMRTSDSGPTPDFLGGSVIMTCDDCGHEVNVSNSSLKRMKDFPGMEINCMYCAAKKVDWGDKAKSAEAADPSLQPFVDEREDDLLDYLRGFRE